MSVTTPIPIRGTRSQAQSILRRIQAWPHWEEIGLVAAKEYGMSRGTYQECLPQFQRFMTLFAVGYESLGMFSPLIDQVWHALILATFRYQDFCQQFHGGVMIHHLPQLEPKKYQQCTVCVSCRNCSIKCNSSCKGDGGDKRQPIQSVREEMSTAQAFIAAWRHTFQEDPLPIWNLPPIQEIEQIVGTHLLHL